MGSSPRSSDANAAESAVERTLGTLASLNPIRRDDVIPDGEGANTRSPQTQPTAAQSTGTHSTAAQSQSPLPAPAQSDAPITIDDIYRSHRMGMVRLGILLVDDLQSAEDVVQEAFAGMYKNWSNLRDRRAAIGYLRTAVVNGSRSMLRRRRTARNYVPPDSGTARSAESLAIMTSEHRAVVAALSELPDRQREVLVLRYYGSLSEAEIAEATGLARGTVKSTASRAIAKLTAALQTQDQG